MIALSLRGALRKGLSLLLVGAMLSTVSVPSAQAADKEAAYAELQALGERIESLSGLPDADLEGLRARYRELSARFGGDQPASLTGGQSEATPKPRVRKASQLGGPGSCVATGATFSNNTPQTIPPTAPPIVLTSTIVVSGVGPVLYDLDLTTFITHTFNGDLDITLQSPAGTIVTVTTDNGSLFNDVYNGTVWDDDANPSGQVPYVNNNGLATDHLYVDLVLASPLVPEEHFSAFFGEDPNGTWTLTLSDDANLDGGTFSSWSLDLLTGPDAPTTTTATFTNNTPVPIPTGPAVVTSTIVVPATTDPIFKVTVQTTITHVNNIDLDFTLTSPAGTVITLGTDNGGTFDNVYNGTVWDDDANPLGQVPYANNPGLVNDHLYANLTLASPLVPEEALGALIGEDATGTWTLTISDDLANNGGSLDSWAVTVTSGSCAAATVAPQALAVDATGNGVLQPNETAVVVQPTWANTSTVAIASLTGTLSNFTGPAGPTYTIDDSAADYGAIAANASASCGANCYAVTAAAASRPATHWDASADETVSVGPTTQTWTLHVGDSFTDVPPSNGFYRFIETILHHNVTSGCAATTYCPGASTTREAMAVFVLVASDPTGAPPPLCVAGSERFTDVPATSGFCRWIEELERRAVVSGCTATTYCPTAPATREQMAVFVLRTLDPTLNPPACVAGSETFADVPSTNGFCRWIEELERRGVVTGCGGGNYCPTADVTREQMSVFLGATFSLTLYGL